MSLRVNLTTRLTPFFLGALALVLVGFSGTIYLVARSGLSRHADDRLSAALGALAAAVEFDGGAMEWEPNQRLLALGQEPEADEVR
jgi:two-component system OmpR family sensor kinase